MGALQSKPRPPSLKRPMMPTPAKVMSCTDADIRLQSEPNPNGEATYLITPGSTTSEAINLACHQLTEVKVPIVIPTETVYGLAASALDGNAVSLIFSIKGRPADNPLIVHVSSRNMLESILPSSYTMSGPYQKLINEFWPGPLTLLFPVDSTKIPSIVTAGQSTVAVRMPSHPVARAIISLSGTPLAAPSANSSGKPSPTKMEHVWHDLGETGKVSLILDGGPCDVGVESTVVDGLQVDGKIRILRPGGVTVEDIERVVGDDLAEGEKAPQVLVHRRDYEDKVIEEQPTTPGMKYLHYSPSVPVILLLTPAVAPLPPATASLSLREVLSDALSPPQMQKKRPRLGIMLHSDSPFDPQVRALVEDVEFIDFSLGPLDSPSTTAQRIFDGLLTLEREGVEMILVEGIAEEREGLAVMNRLRKAASEVKWVNV
ncbi:hypothetical protein FRB94_006287 [Tulasnella sp. JGI-2019a]|nr:hypothetical protein FRB94_006287 [Tulasnella sp. JGI-2019a]KAG9017431.1 hypothetical protein FRB93_007546 [Tulasnella sp. JGI-2019a]KAG9038543.1 hypothetical protein FRB95_000764 [Tulasnella sp. JGI-2019a]